jgi:hypothetical protein
MSPYHSSPIITPRFNLAKDVVWEHEAPASQIG